MFTRSLTLPRRPKDSFFLWGPRQTGKSSLLHAMYPNATWVDLLLTDDFARYPDLADSGGTEVLSD